MSDTMRWRYGETNPVLFAVDAATVIEIGDLVYLEVDDIRPAASQADQLTEEANQSLFASKFAGVAMQRSRAGDTADVRVATSGAFEFDCPSGTFEAGAVVGGSENTAGTALLNQQVETIARPENSLGMVARRAASATTRVLVEVRSHVFGAHVPGLLERRNAANVETLTGTKTFLSDDARLQVLDPGGAGRNVVLPKEAASPGVDFIVHNSADAAEVLTIKASDGATTVCTPTQNETALLFCDGTTWRGIVGANN